MFSEINDDMSHVSVEGKLIKLTEDHRLTSYSERLRIREVGPPLRDEETRLAGIIVASCITTIYG